MATKQSSIHGLITGEEVVESITLEESLTDSPQGVIVYSLAGSLESVRAAAPSLGEKSEHFPSECILSKREFETTAGGETVRVTLTFKPTETETEDDDTDSSSENGAGEMSFATEERSILLHPSFATLGENVKWVAKALIDGKSHADPVRWTKGANGKITLDPPESATTATSVVLFGTLVKSCRNSSALAETLISQILAGNTTYSVYSINYELSSVKSSLNGLTASLGKAVSTPSGAPSGASWIYTGATARRTSSAEKWTVTRVYKGTSSAWNSTLYGKT